MLLLDRIKFLIQSKKIIYSLLILSLMIGGFVIYILLTPSDKEEKDFRPIHVGVEEVRRGSLSRKLIAVGNLVANQTVIIRPEITGVVGKIYFKGGDFVREGETIFELDDRQIRAELKEAEARLAFATSEFERANSLASKNFGSRKNLDDAKAKLLIAEAAVESQKVKLDRTHLNAPFTGLVSIHGLSIGAVVSPDKELATFIDISPIQVEFKIPAQYLKFINRGQRIDIFVDEYDNNKPIQGIISNIDSKIDANTHSVTIRALMPNKEALLRPGLFARVELNVGSKDNTMIISSTSLMNHDDIEQVYKIFEGIAFTVDVRTGIRNGDSVEVISGLNPGDHIVSEGHLKIRDKYPVRYELNGISYAYNKEKFEEKINAINEKNKSQDEKNKPQDKKSQPLQKDQSQDEKSKSKEDSEKQKQENKPLKDNPLDDKKDSDTQSPIDTNNKQESLKETGKTQTDASSKTPA